MKQWFSKSLWNESKQKSTISIVRLQATEEVAKGEFKLWAAGEIKHKATYSREDIKVNQRGNTVFCSFSKPISISLELSSLA